MVPVIRFNFRNYVNVVYLRATVLCGGTIVLEAEDWCNLVPSEIVSIINCSYWTGSTIYSRKITRRIEVVDS